MKIINGKIKCNNEYEQQAIASLLFPETFNPEYTHPKAKKYYNKLLTNHQKCDIIKSLKEKKR